jgi:ribonuclease BN (tRNA processing enzyme)
VSAPRALTVLGCDGSWVGPGGAASGYVVEAERTAVLLDAGPGTFAALQSWGDPGDVDAVILTHEHPDHWTDLETFATWAGYGPGRQRVGAEAPLAVYAPPGLRQWSHYADAAFLDWHELAPSMVLTIGALQARFVATDHGPPTVAVGFTHQGATLAYSADTGPGWSVEELGAGIGTFLCEATYLGGDEGTHRHLSGREAGAMARAAGVERLILTHRGPTVSADGLRDEAAAAFGRAVSQAHQGDRFTW